MTLHIPTLLLTLVVATVTMSLAIAYITYRRQQALVIMAGGLLLHGLGYGLFSVRGLIPDAVSVVLANVAVHSACALYVLALYRLQERPPTRWLLVLPVLVIALTLPWLLRDYTLRRLLVSAVSLFQFGHMLVLLHQRRHVTPGRGHRILAFAALLTCALMLYRLGVTLAGWDTARQVTDSTFTVVTTFMLVLMVILLLSTGTLLMVQERSEHALAASEARYRLLVESANEGICVIANGHIEFINTQGAALFGHPPAALLHQPITAFIHPDDRDRVRDNHHRRLQGVANGVTYAARVLTTPEHITRWFEVSGVALEWHGQHAALNFFTDITERKEMEERIEHLAFHDALTGLPNRRLLLDRITQAQHANARSHGHSALVFLDLDNFKPLNDRHGHATGDLLLVQVAQRLHQHTRAADTVARLGGDEFVLLLHGLGPDLAPATAQAHMLAQRTIATLAQPYTLPLGSDHAATTVTHHCTASAGVALFSDDSASANDVLDHADAAMYAAKAAGRGQVHLFSDADRTPEAPSATS